MKILVACEESQVVTKAFRAKGHEAYSCDLLPCSGGHPEWHLQQNVIPLLLEKWDMLLAFPPCTHLAVSGARWFKEKKQLQKEAIAFVEALWVAPINKISIENPISVLSTKSMMGKPTQIIQPWQFGHGETKSTCLWLHNLPKLMPTKIVTGRESRIHYMSPSPERSTLRSKTYQGIAEAMANQWGNLEN